MSRYKNKKLAPRPFWLFVETGPARVDALTIGLASGEEALPVFSFEDEARMFLELGAPDGNWQVRVTAGGELASVLCGPCASIDRVVLDPIPLRGSVVEGLYDLLSLGREVFIGSLLDKRCFRPSTTGRSVDCRPAGVTAMRGRLFDGDGSHREMIDAVAHAIDHHLSGDKVLGLRSAQQAMQLEGLLPDKRRDLAGGLLAIFAEKRKE